MNPATADCPLRPVLLEGACGALMGFYRSPDAAVATRGDVLVVPAFAEEMNRCRAMVTIQAQALAGLGIGTLVLDMFGTGDSAGEFDQANWDLWRQDLALGIDWLRTHANGCVGLLGIRLGALMAAELAAADPGIEALLLWQPVISGKAHWTQFLRVRIAAEMALADGVKSTEQLRQQSAAGQTVEASGYAVGPKLATRLDQLTMPTGDRLVGKSIGWLEVGGVPGAALPRANAKVLEDWQASGVTVQVAQVTGPSFWQVHERDVAPDLVAATTRLASTWALRTARPAPPAAIGAAAFESTSPWLHAGRAEYPVAFACAGTSLAGMVHSGAADTTLGIVIVVAGGPQYRVGAHRQFVSLARLFAQQGYPVLRFDLRGMGDSGGDYQGYHHSRADIRAAIDELMQRLPQLRQVMLFGECESASGILFYASEDVRVRQIALANPWVRTAEGQAEVILKHYYLDRLMSREFWRSVRQGKYRMGASLTSFASVIRTYWRGRRAARSTAAPSDQAQFDNLPLPAKTAEGLRRFKGSVLVLMSGRDYIAREFDEVTRSHPAWAGLLSQPRVRRKDIADADHTFSRPEWKAEAQSSLLDWLAKPNL